MKNTINAHTAQSPLDQDFKVCFDKDFFSKSKYLLVAMSVASLYCLGYGVVLFHEFKKMGVLQAVIEML